jgi:hypothetical protein
MDGRALEERVVRAWVFPSILLYMDHLMGHEFMERGGAAHQCNRHPNEDAAVFLPAVAMDAVCLENVEIKLVTFRQPPRFERRCQPKVFVSRFHHLWREMKSPHLIDTRLDGFRDTISDKLRVPGNIMPRVVVVRIAVQDAGNLDSNVV